MARRHGAKKIAFTSWLNFQLNANGLAVGGTAASTAFIAGAQASTLMRTRGNLVAWYDGVQAPGTSTRVAVGLIVMPEGQGTTVVSSPVTDPNAPWFYYSIFTLGYEETVVDTIDIPGLTSYRETIDSKAMRIIRADREVQFVVETASVIGAGSAVNVAMDGRALVGV